jgi:hypothetical protein
LIATQIYKGVSLNLESPKSQELGNFSQFRLRYSGLSIDDKNKPEYFSHNDNELETNTAFEWLSTNLLLNKRRWKIIY